MGRMQAKGVVQMTNDLLSWDEVKEGMLVDVSPDIPTGKDVWISCIVHEVGDDRIVFGKFATDASGKKHFMGLPVEKTDGGGFLGTERGLKFIVRKTEIDRIKKDRSLV